ncbi:hypothetical protein [Brucella anthropi]|uniref:Uncharacterized protein n=1 Tax=Brucella anthropi TaxID=529 RepID=A0A6L3YYY7_BRUAN|nr:hypothetical protein [Brucella anthropi]KAB2758249.1 hypothetical protein F9L04_24855 [Brucella anthropi]UVV66687.1 hypothetical protein NW321_09370 [Brucella anthropi]
MKYAFLITAVLLSTSAAQASEQSKDETCKKWGDLAAKIMDLRQLEEPMSSVIKLIASDKESKITRAIIIDAYNQPSYKTKQNQKRATDEYRNKVELECFKNAE